MREWNCLVVCNLEGEVSWYRVEHCVVVNHSSSRTLINNRLQRGSTTSMISRFNSESDYTVVSCEGFYFGNYVMFIHHTRILSDDCNVAAAPILIWTANFNEMFRLIYGRGLLSLAFCDAYVAVYLFTVRPQGKILCRSINGALKPLDQLLHQTVWVWSSRLVSFPVASIRIKISQILYNFIFKWIELLINIRREASKHNQCRVKSSSNVLSLMQLSREETVTRHSWRTIY